MISYLSDHWFDVVQTIAILATLLVTLATIRHQADQTKVANSLLITQHHREIWIAFLQDPDLARVFTKPIDLNSNPVTDKERTFVNLIFLHMSATLKAMRAGASFPVEALDNDVRDILSFPIPQQVWNDVKAYHDQLLLKTIDHALQSHQGAQKDLPQLNPSSRIPHAISPQTKGLMQSKPRARK